MVELSLSTERGREGGWEKRRDEKGREEKGREEEEMGGEGEKR